MTAGESTGGASAGTRRRIGWHLVMLLLLTLGCAPSDDPGDFADTLRVGIEDRPKTLDPRYATDVFGQRIGHHLIFDPLIEHGYELEPIPALATAWERLGDTTWRIELRDDVLFHDGERFTAADVVATFEHFMDEATASPLGAGLREKIATVRAEGDYAVRFELRLPTPSFVELVKVPILPHHLIATARPEGDPLLVGTGPFRLVADNLEGLRLERFAQHFRGPAGVEAIVFDIVRDENTRLLELRKGELDLLINALPERSLAAFERSPLAETYRLVEEPGLSYNYLAFNFDDPVLAKVEVRRAIAHAIDVEALITHRLLGHGVRARSLLSAKNPWHDSSVAVPAYDPDRARVLLDAAGFEDPDGDGPLPRLELELKISNNPIAVDNARAIQAQLAEVGIAVALRSFEWGTFYGDIQKGNFQLTSLRWVGVTDPDFFFDLYHSSRVPPLGRNRGRFADAGLDRLLEEGRSTLDPEQRHALYSQVQHQLAEQLPYVSLWHPNNISVVHRRVRGYRQHPKAGFQSLRQVTLDPSVPP